MKQSNAKIVSFVRTVEASSAGAEIWSGDDADWATRLATQELGEAAPVERFIDTRARIAWQRISDRRPELERALEKRDLGTLFGWAIILLALIAGILTDQIGDSRQVNLLALPFVAIIVWNLAIYAWLLLLRPILGLFGFKGGIRRWLESRLSGYPNTGIEQQIAEKISLSVRCQADWARLSLPATSARVARVLHLAAAMFVFGLIVAIYSRGFYTEYRVGWESTLLDASDISAALATFFNWMPITFGLAAPDPSTVEQMRFSAGGGLIGARPWLHLLAFLAIALVILPRLALVAFASFRLRMFERRFPIDLTRGYFQKLAARYARKPREVVAIPYAKALLPESAIVLNQVVQDVFGTPGTVRILDTVQFGGEDDMPVLASKNQDSIHLALFDLASTPESENHGVFLKALKREVPSGHSVISLVDSREFKARFGSTGDRLEQRTKLWRRFLEDCAVPCVIGDLAEVGSDELRRNFESALAEAGGGRHE
ncbi:MAG: DUF2868 domain-containing protein [Propionivibrio sp.]|uniref:DUF2868 domain-containing protein n=1 Tax=Candidatus Propionivibrio dominans TaxID=2954373 RepID=A0A9D7FAQ5_9RHOO|nr:DUF2868 domain-containing protein [Candidatus Propionivibrio dominans]